jgi:hypothetical protein
MITLTYFVLCFKGLQKTLYSIAMLRLKEYKPGILYLFDSVIWFSILNYTVKLITNSCNF